MARWAPITLALALAGCTCGAPEEPATTTAPTIDPASPAPAAGTGGSGERTRPAIDPVIARRVRDAVREGRRLSHDGQHAEALTRFEAALELAPSPKLQCEAGFVAHRAGRHERARELVERALHVLLDRLPSNADRVPLAMCLYNAGLVYEQAGLPQRALEAYERSLALRDHATVRGHADAMRAQVAGATAPTEVVSLGAFDAASDAEIDARIVRQLCADAGLEGCIVASGDEDESDEQDEDEPVEGETTVRLSTQAPEGTANGLEARIVTASAEWDENAYLVVSVGTRRVAGPIAYSHNPGSLGISGELVIDRLRYEDVIPGGAVEVVAIGTTSVLDLDMAGCEYWGSTTRTLVVCTAEDGAPRCASIALEGSSDSGSEDFDGCAEMYGEGESAPEAESHGFSFEYAIEGGDLVLTAGRTIDPSDDPAGRHPFAQLVADASRRWP